MTEEPGGANRSFEERLKAARGRQGLDVPPQKPGSGPDEVEKSPLGIGLRVGLELVTALVVAVAIGYGLDRLFGTTPIFMVVFIPLGGAAGVMNVWRLFAPKPTDRSKTGDVKGGG
jgi:ATP synthase protein I